MITDERKRDIISSSISNAICIDDEFCAPYDTEGRNLDAPKSMRDSFRNQHQCNLEIYRYTNFGDIKTLLPVLFKNRDLLILDWELNPSEQIKYQDTLKIIEAGVDSKTLRYIVIYTQNTDTENICKVILRAFSKYRQDFSDIEKNILENLDEFCAENELDFDGDKVWSLLKHGVSGISLNPTKIKDIKNNIAQKLDENMHKTVKGKLCRLINRLVLDEGFQDINQTMSWLDTCITVNEALYSDNPHETAPLTPNSIQIDNTILVILHKGSRTDGDGVQDAVMPKDVFDKIVESVLNITNIRTFLFSIILRNIMNDEISQWGKNLGGISEQALLFHAKSYNEADEFIQYFTNCTTGLLKSSLLSTTSKEYIHELFKEAPMAKAPSQRDLCNLNCFLTFTDKNQFEDTHSIQTGDIFALATPYDPSNGIDEYVICITQSCDCKEPKKINHNYAFLHGHKADLKQALTSTEKEWYSFISSELAIKWSRRFFTIHLESQKKFHKWHPIRVVLNNGKNNELTFLGNQKIEYTQRLINYAFSYAQRMGVDLPHYPEND